MPDITLSDYIAAANRGLLNRLIPAGFFAKQTYLQQNSVFTATYGKMVWDALNNQTKFWNTLEKVPWGPTVGWRIRSGRGTGRSRPVTEAGALPTINASTYNNVSSNPRIVVTDFGVTVLAQFLGGVEGGLGDTLATEQEAAARDHIKELNQELLLGSSSVASGAATTFQPEYFRVGDTLWASSNDETMDTHDTITAISGTTLTGLTSANAESIYIRSRAGITSLDDIVEQDSRNPHGVSLTAGDGVGVYNFTAHSDRASGAYNAAATVLGNSGTARDLTTALLDQAIREIRLNGGEPDLILTNYDQHDKLNSLMQSQQRFVDEGEFKVKLGDESTLPGYKTGLTVATYRGIPVLPDADVRFDLNSSGTTRGSYVYVLDTRHLKIAIANATNYIENRDFFQANAMVIRGLFWTMAELRASRLDVHAKIVDLSA